MKKTILVFAVILLLLSIPLVSATQYQTQKEIIKTRVQEKINNILTGKNSISQSNGTIFLLMIAFTFDVVMTAIILKLITGNPFSQTLTSGFVFMILLEIIHCFVLPWIISGYQLRNQ